MKNFQNYKLSKNDIQLISNFKLDREFRELSKDELDEYWFKILNYQKLEVHKSNKRIKAFYKYLMNITGFVSIINNTEYFFFSFNEKNFYNIYFYNMNNIKECNNNLLTNSRESIEIFKVMCNILQLEREKQSSLSYKIQLPKKFSKLYFKLIDKFNRIVWKNTKMNIKKLKNNYYYYYRGNSNEMYHSLSYLKSVVLYYKKPFMDINSYIKKYKAK